MLFQFFGPPCIHPSKSYATPLWSIISICVWVYIQYVRYNLKAWLFVFPFILNLSWLLCRNVRSAIKLGSMSKINVAKLDHNFNRWYQFVHKIIFIVLGIIWKPIYFLFLLVYYLLWLSVRNVRKIIILDAIPKNNSKIASLLNSASCFVPEHFGTMNGPGRSGYECIRSQKESTKQDITRISHIESDQFCNSSFLPSPQCNLLILHTPQWNNPNK